MGYLHNYLFLGLYILYVVFGFLAFFHVIYFDCILFEYQLLLVYTDHMDSDAKYNQWDNTCYNFDLMYVAQCLGKGQDINWGLCCLVSTWLVWANVTQMIQNNVWWFLLLCSLYTVLWNHVLFVYSQILLDYTDKVSDTEYMEQGVTFSVSYKEKN